MTSGHELALHVGNRASGLANAASLNTRRASASIARAGRLALMAAGIPLKKEFLVLRCAAGADASGLFSELAAVIGALEHYESWRGVYAGLRVDFGREGLYYDPAAGENWWDYYFEPIDCGHAGGARRRTPALWEHDAFARRLENGMSRASAAAFIGREIRVKADLKAKVEHYLDENFSGRHVIGVHYRGTDKVEDSPPVPYEDVSEALGTALRTASAENGMLFVATDEQAFLDRMRILFPGKVLCLDMGRSRDGRPMHKQSGNNFAKGENAIMDCLLLSRCRQLFRTDSNLGLFATLFNPAIPDRLLAYSNRKRAL